MRFMNVEQVCASWTPKDVNTLWNLWAVVFLFKAKRRVSSKVNKRSNEEYLYLFNFIPRI